MSCCHASSRLPGEGKRGVTMARQAANPEKKNRMVASSVAALPRPEQESRRKRKLKVIEEGTLSL